MPTATYTVRRTVPHLLGSGSNRARRKHVLSVEDWAEIRRLRRGQHVDLGGGPGGWGVAEQGPLTAMEHPSAGRVDSPVFRSNGRTACGKRGEVLRKR